MADPIRDLIRKELSAENIYRCDRVWSAWHYGTMGEDDFIAAEDYDPLVDGLAEKIQRLIDEARLEEHRAISPWAREPQTLAAINFRTAIVRRSMDESLHVPGTTAEPVAPEYKDARWGKPK